MKLDCELVRELYVLYQEGELSSPVRERVEKHLADCPECTGVYSSGTGLSIAKELVPAGVDEKIALRLKVTKLKIVAVFVIAILVVFSFSDYRSSRDFLHRDLSAVEHQIWSLIRSPEEFLVRDENTSQGNAEVIAATNENLALVERNLNIVEKRWARNSGDLSLSHQLGWLTELLWLRRQHDSWGPRDEAIREYIIQRLQASHLLLTDERLAFYDGLLFNLVDTRNLVEYFREINTAINEYFYYGALPGELEQLAVEELEKRVKDVLAWSDIRVDLNSTDLSGHTNFKVSGDKQLIEGYIDRYTGAIKYFWGNYRDCALDGELVDYDAVGEDLKGILTRLYGPGYTFDLEYKGINYNYSTNLNTKLHCYKWVPRFQGFQVYSNQNLLARYDARSGLLADLDGIPVPGNAVDVSVNYTAEEGVNILELDAGYSPGRTVIIPSALSDTWILAHEYISKSGRPRYLNTVTGKEDFIHWGR